MANSYLQVRIDEKDKQKASAILEDLGTNLSMVINMLLKQIIMTKSIPFDISIKEQKLTPEEEEAMALYQRATKQQKEAIRKLIEQKLLEK